MIESLHAESRIAPRLLTYRQAARLLQVTERTVFNLTHSGSLACVRIGRSVRIDQEDIDRFIASKKCTTRTGSA